MLCTHCEDHAVIFPDGATATKEGNNENEDTNGNQEAWRGEVVSVKQSFVRAILSQNHSTNRQNHYARDLQHTRIWI